MPREDLAEHTVGKERPSGATEEREGAAGSPPLPGLPYLQDFLGIYAGIMTEQALRLNGIFQRMSGRDYTTDKLIADGAWFGTEWIRDVMQIGASFQRSAMADALPNIVFILDHAAQGADPKEIPVAMRIDRSVRIAPTPLTRIPEGGEIGIQKVDATLVERQQRLRVSVADVGGLKPGHYVGWIYVDSEGSKAPLAAVHLVKLGNPRARRPSGKRTKVAPRTSPKRRR